MTPLGARRLRQALLALVAAVALAVVLSLRRPPGTPPTTPSPSAPPAAGTTMGQVVLRKFVEGAEKYLVKARSMTGEEQGKMKLVDVELTFPYVAQGKPATASVTSRECAYDADRQRANFRGNVKVAGSDGFLLETETLDYQGDRGAARTLDPVKFKRGALSGESTGAEYRAEQEALDLPADVVLVIERPGAAPTEVRSGQAEVRRQESAVRFSGGVKVTRGAEYLEAQQLNLEMSADFEKVDRAVAIEEVSVRGGAAILAGGVGGKGQAAKAQKAPGGPGSRVLRCRRLDAWFRENGELRDVTAVKNAELEIIPGPGAPPETRRVRAHALTFRFDEQGRLVVLEGGPEAVLSGEPRPEPNGKPLGARTVKSNAFTMNFDPAKGDLTAAEFTGGVEMTEPGRKAWAEHALLNETQGILALTGNPRVLDEARGGDLRADAIDIGTRSQNLAARENVRHLVALQRGRPGALPQEPSLFLARYLDYDSATKSARYRENALLRSGKDELRAPLIVVEEAAPGHRRLTASGGVASLLHPRPGPETKKPPLPVDVHAAEMVYEEARGETVYKGDVVIRQGDIRSTSPQAIVTLNEDGSAVETLVAGEPVEVVQGARKANGTKGTYTPRTETLLLVGEKVLLQDPAQRTEGRSLTFRVGDDTIRVDGREEVRTESVFKRELPKH